MLAIQDRESGAIYASDRCVIHADLVDAICKQLDLPVRERAPGEAAFAANGASPFGRFICGHIVDGEFVER